MFQIPSPADVEALHRKYAPTNEAFDLVFTHCQIVAEIADQLAARQGPSVIDRELVRAACLLHDVGVYRLYDTDGRLDKGSYIRHGILGHRLLQEEGFDLAICRFCSCHTGMGLTKQDILAQRLPLPAADYLAVTPEERLLMYADKFHTKASPPRLLMADTYREQVRRFGEEKARKFDLFRAEFGEPDLAATAEIYCLAVE